MLKVTIKGLLAKKLRLFTTSLAVLIGVAFMAGTLVLTDTIGKTFDDLFATVNEGVDAHVRGEEAFESDFGETRPRVDESLVDELAGLPDVASLEGYVEGYAQIVGADGEVVGNPAQGAPTFGRSWGRNEELNPFTLVEGRAPESGDEVVVDRFTARESGHSIGDTATVLTQGGAVEVTIVGIATFGSTDSPGGTTNVMFTTEAAQRHLAEPGKLDAISVVAADGVSETELRDTIAAAVPDGVEVLTGAEITEESQSAIAEGLGFFSTFLLTFAAIALFVGAFIIYNTFSIIVAQRTREMALLRALGASRRQVLGSVMVEALVVGVIASVVGLFAGIGVASLLKALLTSLGVDIPAEGIVLKSGTVIASLIVGIGVSVVSAVFPARRGSKVPPVAAMRDVAVDHSGTSRVRVVAGVVVSAAGMASLLGGLFGGGDSALPAVGLGAAVVFVGVAILGPTIARPVSRLIGAPLPRIKGMPGTLARENAMRNPKRTSATAAALMIGVGLVGFIAIVASSAKASIDRIIDDTFTADFVVDSGSFGVGGLSTDIADRLNDLPEVAAATGIRFGQAEIAGDTTDLLAVDPDTAAEIIDFGVTAGSVRDLDVAGIAVHESVAEEDGLAVGDTVRVTFPATGEQELTVRAVYGEEQLTGGYLIGLPTYEANYADQFDVQVWVDKVGDVTGDEARAAIETVTGDFATAEVQDLTEFKDAQAAQVDPILNLIYVLLTLAILIALLGIANTLALSIFERTRELGLLRAVGMTRSQLRSTVRWESVIIALLGTVLGLVIGAVFGGSLVLALADEGITELVIPVGTLAVIGLLAAVAGVLAAVLPARRAARLDVLSAIVTE